MCKCRIWEKRRQVGMLRFEPSRPWIIGRNKFQSGMERIEVAMQLHRSFSSLNETYGSFATFNNKYGPMGYPPLKSFFFGVGTLHKVKVGEPPKEKTFCYAAELYAASCWQAKATNYFPEWRVSCIYPYQHHGGPGGTRRAEGRRFGVCASAFCCGTRVF